MAKKQIATFLGPQPGLSYAGEFAYGYSGNVTFTTGSDTTLFEFTTGTAFVVGTFAFGLNNVGISPNKAFGYKISINGEVVFENFDVSDSDGTLNYVGGTVVQNILLPPLSTIKIEAVTTDDSNLIGYGMITGRVYNA